MKFEWRERGCVRMMCEIGKKVCENVSLTIRFSDKCRGRYRNWPELRRECDTAASSQKTNGLWDRHLGARNFTGPQACSLKDRKDKKLKKIVRLEKQINPSRMKTHMSFIRFYPAPDIASSIVAWSTPCLRRLKKPVPAPTSRIVIPCLMGTCSRRRKPKGADQRGNSSYMSPNSAC